MNDRSPRFALRWEGERVGEDGRVARLAVAGMAPAPAGGRNRPGLVPLGGGRLERRPLGLHGAHDPARGPGVREQAGLRPEGPLHDLAGGPLGGPAALRRGSALVAPRRPAARQAGGGRPRRRDRAAAVPADRQRPAGELRRPSRSPRGGPGPAATWARSWSRRAPISSWATTATTASTRGSGASRTAGPSWGAPRRSSSPSTWARATGPAGTASSSPSPEAPPGGPMFSARTRWDLSTNRLSAALDAKRRSGARFLDLTESNPTRAGLSAPPDLLASLARPASLVYEPAPFGLAAARAAVAADCSRRGFAVGPDRILLTASTSEAYGFLFK